MCFPRQLMPQAEARLTAGDPVKNARALLRYALPISNEPARRIQVGGAAPAPRDTLRCLPGQTAFYLCMFRSCCPAVRRRDMRQRGCDMRMGTPNFHPVGLRISHRCE